MIKKIQNKIIIVITGIIAFVLLILSLVIIATSIINEKTEAKRFLENLASEKINKDGPKKYMEHRSFIVTIDQSGNALNYDFKPDFFTYETIRNYYETILKKGKIKEGTFGKIDDIFYLIKLDKTNNYLILGIDFSMENEMLSNTIKITLFTYCLGIIVIFLIVWVLSFWIIKPIKNSFIKQKQFISDASHELKTPLTIINANIDVLKNDFKNNEWLKNIESQSKRMNGLVNDMISLAKLEEIDISIKTEFDLGKAILNTALPFDAVCFENKKQYDINVETNIIYFGNEEAVKKVVGILIDNAIKHSKKDALIKVEFKIENNISCLTVYNTGCEITNQEREKIFERFYRKDLSRNQETGGSGLGLAIVKEISEKEKWKISVDSNLNEFIEFKITF